MRTEWTALLLAIGIYGFDCLVLLERGQGLLERAGWRWRLLFGAPYYLIRGKPVVLMNPLTPCFPVFQTLPLRQSPENRHLRPSEALRLVSSLRVLSLGQFVLVFIALPIFLYRAPGWPFVVSLALSYLNAVAMLCLLVRAYRKAGVASKGLLSLAFGCIVCLPLSVNVLRRGALGLPLSGDTVRFMRLVPRAGRDLARARLLQQVTEAIAEAEEDSRQHASLVALQHRLTGEKPHG